MDGQPFARTDAGTGRRLAVPARPGLYSSPIARERGERRPGSPRGPPAPVRVLRYNRGTVPGGQTASREATNMLDTPGGRDRCEGRMSRRRWLAGSILGGIGLSA